MASHDQQSSDNFLPRKEFIRQSSRSLSSFALLTFSASSLIRLYAFPPLVISSLRRYLDQRKFVTAYREDTANNCCEFALHGKPWYNSKAISTERLLVNVIAVVLQSGYSFLSTLDYGREQDDRIAIAFSKPRQLSSNLTGPTDSQSHMTTNITPIASVQSTSLQIPFIVPFAVSFTSATTLRVISPPLHSTPAILGAVRGAWPRGVVSEKKVGDACYEFRLKGYRWFQEDNFAVDSLRHILSLLESLDSHSFTLLTSLSLSSRSRVKDFWIFTGLSDNPNLDVRLNQDLDSPASPPATPALSTTEVRALKSTKKQPLANDKEASVPAHKKMLSVPALYGQHSQPSFSAHHTRASSDGVVPLPTSMSHPHDVGSLRPAPRLQILVPVTESSLPASTNEGERTTLPSSFGSAINMTGVGAGARALAASEKPDVHITLPEPTEHPNNVISAPEELSSSQMHEIVAPVPVLAIHNGSPLLRPSYGPESSAHSKGSVSNNSTSLDTPQYLEVPVHSDSTASSPKHWTPPVDQPRTPSPPPASPTPPPFGRYRQNLKGSLTGSTLFGPGAFSTGNEENQEIVEFRDSAFTTGSDWKSCEIPIKWTGPAIEPKRRPSTGPSLPGAWDPSPVTEYDDDDGGEEVEKEEFQVDHREEQFPDTQDADTPVESSEPMQTEDSVGGKVGPPYQSEVGVADAMPDDNATAQNEKQSDAWVMVTVQEGAYLPVLEGQRDAGAEDTRPSDPAGLSIHSTMKDQSSSENKAIVNAPELQAPSGMPASVAKRMMIDSSSAKKIKNNPSPSLSPPSSLPQPGKHKRLLLFSRKDKEDKFKRKGGLRLRWKKLGSSTD